MTFEKEFAHRRQPGLAARETIYAIVAAALVFAAILAIGQTIRVAAADGTPPATVQKSDRMTSALPASCQGETWGNWSPDCAAALSGQDTLRQVRFETFETRPAADNVSILERVPTRS